MRLTFAIVVLVCLGSRVAAQGAPASRPGETGVLLATVFDEAGSRLGSLDAVIEEEEAGQIALEAGYVGRQALADDPYREVSKPYVLLGVLAMKRVGPAATLFLNGENLLDVRLSHYQPFVRPAPGPGGRWTVDAWAPLEGRFVNGGVRFAIP